jgi:aspartyl-tRNA(Asn)/glutamyl-tRNA(Gln) amidotransferase subunit C
MAIDDAALDKLAFLARLELPEATRERVRGDLERMLGFVDALQQADVDSIEPMAHPAASYSVLRTDQVDVADRSEALLALAPAASAGLYLVPKVIE